MAAPKGGKKVIRRRRERKNIEKGAAHIQSTFNNTIVTISDTQGNAVSSAITGAGIIMRLISFCWRSSAALIWRAQCCA